MTLVVTLVVGHVVILAGLIWAMSMGVLVLFRKPSSRLPPSGTRLWSFLCMRLRLSSRASTMQSFPHVVVTLLSFCASLLRLLLRGLVYHFPHSLIAAVEQLFFLERLSSFVLVFSQPLFPLLLLKFCGGSLPALCAHLGVSLPSKMQQAIAIHTVALLYLLSCRRLGKEPGSQLIRQQNVWVF
eukprot:CAMPEP_0179425878 /NCGR_PEP_ID=MMETSP0799-20121207/12420_1 /TAXON_ID=46947 /ORGANISM="Geminigera cryophila, Strain CCMP2564" /LENGTH=183 /DNA_ID=CAMNT_0021200553 /DNA_START=368 /DNA_END=919 /DNA_ORIENTATION=-